MCEVGMATDAGVTLLVPCWQHYQSFPQSGRCGSPLLFVQGQLTPLTHLSATRSDSRREVSEYSCQTRFMFTVPPLEIP